MRRALVTLILLAGLVAAAASSYAASTSLALHVQKKLSIRENVHLSFRAAALPKGGYYYAVIVLRPYKDYTSEHQPPCAASSNMQKTDYGYPYGGKVVLALTPTKSHTGHWCPGAIYEGAIYAVPHAPPCESSYPCRSEPYEPREPPSPCWNAGGQRVCGVVIAVPTTWRYPDSLPRPLAKGTTIVGHFVVRFPSGA